MAALVEDLQDWIRIPSIGADPQHADDMQSAAEWTAQRLRAFGSEVEFVELGGPGPLVIGRVAASQGADTAPTYLIYGHYDVQPAGEGWTCDPFDPIIKDGWIYGRGSSDDKGQFLSLIAAVDSLSQQAALGVNIVFLADSAEETLGLESSTWLRQHCAGLAGALLFDSSFLNEQTPVINTSTRGLVKFELTCRTASNDLHSGLAGGAAKNAYHELIDLLHGLLPRDGFLPEPLMRNAIAPTNAELERWSHLASGASLLAAQGGTPADPSAAAEYYLRTWARPALDIHGFRSSSAEPGRTVVIAEATVSASIRLAPGQTPEQVVAFLNGTLDAARASSVAEFELSVTSCTNPSFSDESSELLRVGRAAFEEVWGITPQFLRAGGTLPFVATLTELGLPFLLSGLHLPEGNAHGPDEKLKLTHLYDGVRLVIAILKELGTS